MAANTTHPEPFPEPSAITDRPPPGDWQKQMDRGRDEERRKAMRALLQNPLLTAQGSFSAEFGLVRRHAGWLRDWLAKETGWSLTVDSEVARLRKTPPDTSDGTRAACDAKSQLPFSRRRYVLVCLALAALERSDRQTTLGRLAEDVVSFASADPGLVAAGAGLSLENYDHRRDLVQVIRLLLDLRVLTRVQGDEQQYLAGRGDVLYNVSRPTLSAMLNVQRGPSTVDARTCDERLAAIADEPVPDIEEARNRRLRWHLVRRLLDDPVVYYDELSPEQLAYLHSQRPRLMREIHDATGLIPEVRREGIALVDDRGDVTDLGIPEEGTEGHVTLLLAEYLAQQLRRDSQVVLSRAAIHQQTARLIEEHRGHWRKNVTEPGAEVRLADETLERLEALRLVRTTEAGLHPLPAVARYAVRGAEEPRVKKTDKQSKLWQAEQD